MEVKGARRSSERNHGKYFVPNRQRRISGSLWLAIDRGNWFEIRGAMECIGNQISCPPATSDVALRPLPTSALFLPPDRQWRVRQGVRASLAFSECGVGQGCSGRRDGADSDGDGGSAMVVVVVVWLLYFLPPLIFPSLRDSRKFHDHDDSTRESCRCGAAASKWWNVELGRLSEWESSMWRSRCRVRLGYYLRRVYVWMRSVWERGWCRRKRR